MSVLRSAVTAAAGLALSLSSPVFAGGGVSISSYGQRSLLIQGGGQSVLLNPYKAVGCAAGLPEPRLTAAISSLLIALFLLLPPLLLRLGL